MLDTPEVVMSPNKEQIILAATNMHRYFDEVIFVTNPGAKVVIDGTDHYPSYHNHHHIESALAAGVAFAKDEDDAFSLRADFEKFKETSPECQDLDFDLDFVPIVEIAFASHDLGNITQSPGLSFNSNDV